MNVQKVSPEDRPSTNVAMKAEVVRKVKYNYMFGYQDSSDRILDSLAKLVVDGLNPGKDFIQFLNEVTTMITTRFKIRNATIGIRDPEDGMLRYVAMSGLDDDEWEAHKALSYTDETFFDPVMYKCYTISELTKLFLIDDSPFNPDYEMSTFNPKLVSAQIRRDADEYKEGDYFDIYIRGQGDKFLGWIEISGTSQGKMPDANALRWIEMIAGVVGLLLTVRGLTQNNAMGATIE